MTYGPTNDVTKKGCLAFILLWVVLNVAVWAMFYWVMQPGKP